MKTLLLFLSVMGTLAFTSCSLKIHHEDGTVTYLGAVNLQEGDPSAAPLLHTRRLGVLLDAGLKQNHFNIGYEDRLIVKPANDKLTKIDYSPGEHRLEYSCE